jgi:subtilisin family serine protease
LEIILDGIEWAVQSGAEVISISFGKFPKELPNAPGYLDGLQNRLEQIIANKKVLIFSSSGDNPPGIVLTKDRYPASFSSCISVGASHLGLVSKVTVLSGHTTIHAEGEDVESYGLNNKVIKLSGTSMATPIVAGVAALAISHLKKKNQGSWDPKTVLKALYDSGKSIPGTNKRLIDTISFFNIL